MIVGIVGHEAAKFTARAEALAREAIRAQLRQADGLASGGCHLGGIDIWAVEEARGLGFPDDRIIEFVPTRRTWSGPGGFEARNLQIAAVSDKLVCIALASLPPTYQGMRFALCYHCKRTDHVKGGGCWTMKQAARLKKPTELIILPD